ncbi:MAG: hypothetical protein ACOCX4_10770 [Planctomycetota bacterium]
MLNVLDIGIGALAGGLAAGGYLALLYAAVRRRAVPAGRGAAYRLLTVARIALVALVVAGVLLLRPGAALGLVAGFVLVRTVALAVVGHGAAAGGVAGSGGASLPGQEDAPQ